jgi:hypothetical protein
VLTLKQETFHCLEPTGELGIIDVGIDALRKMYERKLAEAIVEIRAEVKDEVLAQVPRIRREVAREVISRVPEIQKAVRSEAKKALKPWMIATISVAALGVVAGTVALVRQKRKHRSK